MATAIEQIHRDTIVTLAESGDRVPASKAWQNRDDFTVNGRLYTFLGTETLLLCGFRFEEFDAGWVADGVTWTVRIERSPDGMKVRSDRMVRRETYSSAAVTLFQFGREVRSSHA